MTQMGERKGDNFLRVLSIIPARVNEHGLGVGPWGWRGRRKCGRYFERGYDKWIC